MTTSLLVPRFAGQPIRLTRALQRAAALSLSLMLGLSLAGCETPATDAAGTPVLGGAAPSAANAVELARWQERASRVEIVRDDWGIPHITAPTDADAVFGLMYAQAEDDFPRIERNFLLSLGRLAEAEGEAALWLDLRMQLFIDPVQMQTLYAQSPPFLQALMDAWADGLNYYLATHPQTQPKVLTRFEPWMALSFSEGSIGGDIERVDLTALAEFYEAPANADLQVSAGLQVSADLHLGANDSGIRAVASAGEAQGLPGEPRGSNGIAIAAKHSRSDAALLLINPHTSFYFRHEAQVTSEEGLNAYGALTWGQFFVYQGFNETAGWMHTSSSVDNIDEFLETVVEQDGALVYRYGDELRPVTVRDITLRYRSGGGFKEHTFTTYRTHHGPIVRAADDRWVAVALMEEPLQALIQSFTRTKAKNLQEYLAIMEAHTNSSNNTLFADAEGNIAYLHSNFVPVRDPNLDYRLPVDGSDPATDWDGVHSIDDSPNSINPPTGWVQNTNNWPYSVAGASSPAAADYPPYMDIGSENARGVHALKLLETVDELDLQGLIDLAYDRELTAFDALLPPLFAAADGQLQTGRGDADLAEAVAVLKGWDRRSTKDSVATALAVFYGTALLEEARVDLKQDRSFTNVMEYMAEAMPAEAYIAALGSAMKRLDADFGDWRTPWGEINRFQRLTGTIDLPYDDQQPSEAVGFGSGRWGSLASFGAQPRAGTRRWYGSSGNSFVAVVEFGERVRARAVTAGGLSNQPNSPHFNDQIERYISGDLRDVYFYPEQLEGHIERRYQPGE